MIWIFIIFIITGSIIAIAYPLFWSNLQDYELSDISATDFSQADAWLSGLSDLEDDFVLGRLTKEDYQQQKIFLQRGYLEFMKNSSISAD